jgi:translation initiation factor IF-1
LHREEQRERELNREEERERRRERVIMGRNKFGGNKQKGMANKEGGGVNEERMRFAEGDGVSGLEVYGRVVRALGNGMFHVLDALNRTLVAHVRGKMRGKSKRSNLIKVDDIVLIGLRQWESIPKNCDILYIYDPSQSSILPIHPSLLLDHHHHHSHHPITYDYSSSSETPSPSSETPIHLHLI